MFFSARLQHQEIHFYLHNAKMKDYKYDRCSSRKPKSTMHRAIAQPWNAAAFFLVLLMPLREVSTQTTRCMRPVSPDIVTETTPVGTELLRVPADPDMTWRIEFDSNVRVLEDYVNFNRSETGEPFFILTVAKPFDAEKIFAEVGEDFGGVTLVTLVCDEPMLGEKSSNVLFQVTEVNEFSPQFNFSIKEISVKENTAAGTPIISLIHWATDGDVSYGTREIRDFSIVPAGTDSQALEMFYLADSSNGVIRVREPLDFDTLNSNRVRMQVLVRDLEGLSSTATLSISIEDEDDLPPVFFYSGCSDPCKVVYRVFVSPNTTGELTNIEPDAIQAKDGDSLKYAVTYHLVQGPDNYEDYFSLDPSTAKLTAIKALGGLGVEDLALTVEAREVSILQRSSQASLLISLAGGVVGAQTGSAGTDNALLIAAIILGVLFALVVACLIMGAIFFRKKYKTPVHPEARQPIRKDESPMAEDSPRSRSQQSLSIGPPMTFQPRLLGTELKENGKEKKPLRGDEEVVTWMPFNTSHDIVDLSDEDTIRRKKMIQQPPMDTTLQTPETEYAELVTPPQARKEVGSRAVGNYYTNKAFIKDEPQRKPPRRPGSRKPQKSSNAENSKDSLAQTPNSGSQTSSAEDVEHSQRSFTSDASLSGCGSLTTEVESPRAQPRRQRLSPPTIETAERQYNNVNVNDDHEATEYSVPPSNRPSYAFRPLPVPQKEDNTSREACPAEKQAHKETPQLVFAPDAIVVGENKPSLPPKPAPTSQEQCTENAEEANSVVENKKDEGEVDEPPYATIDKFKKSSITRKAPVTTDHNHDADQSGEAEDSSATESTSIRTDSTTTFALQPPSRRKRPRKRNKQPRAPEEDVYDGTKDYEDLEVDSGFYTDTSKTKIKRSSRLPVMKPDPNDTRYWITISNDY